MSSSSSSAKRLCRLLVPVALTLVNLGACATPPSKASAAHSAPSPDVEAQSGSPTSTAAMSVPARLHPVVRYGRYTLVELSPTTGQEDLMQQIVDVSIPPTLVVSVGDAVRYLLLRSGFTLCDSPEIRILNTLALPAADLHLGPLTLESALRILAGPGWTLEVDELTRRVCFAPVSPPSPAGRTAHAGPKESDKANAARAMAIAPEQR